MHLFLSYLLNDSQKIHFSKLLLLCSDWSISFKAECYFVYSVTVETAPKAPLSGKEWICIFIQTNEKTPTSGRGNMLMIHDDIKQGLVLKTTRFNDSESTLSFERR